MLCCSSITSRDIWKFENKHANLSLINLIISKETGCLVFAGLMVCQKHCQPHQNQTRWSRKSCQRDYSWEIAKIQKWFFFCCQNMTYHVAGFKFCATILLPLLPITGVLCSNGQREGESEWVRGGFFQRELNQRIAQNKYYWGLTLYFSFPIFSSCFF